ncbi:unnamed protein product [Paramecium sonneborni]|uniref:Uncharacterized protein n=1 Tax=Paramecium sonneborni TaxID=65129 RepID=A0A8S1MT75_9CILI|nr:unnamed protein product [Paramecium sonneborni]
MHNQLIERNAIESLLNVCYDEQPQYDDDYEQEIKSLLKRTIPVRVKKEENDIAYRQNTISFRTPLRYQNEFRLKTETRSQIKQPKTQRIPKKIPQITLKQSVKPQVKSFRDINHKIQVPLKTSIVSLQNSTGYSFLNTSEYQNPVLVFQKKSLYLPRFILRLKQQQLINQK